MGLEVLALKALWMNRLGEISVNVHLIATPLGNSRKHIHTVSTYNINFRYDHGISMEPLNPEELCQSLKYRKIIFTRDRPQFQQDFEKWTWNVRRTLDSEKNCLRNMRKLAFVHFYLASSSVTQIKKSLRVSFADTLANFGKNDKEKFVSNMNIIDRRNLGFIHWNELVERGGSCLLVGQIVANFSLLQKEEHLRRYM